MTKPTKTGARKGTRERILVAAEKLILANGYTATSIDSITEEVGITKGAFFYHFDSKNAMAHALVMRNADLDLARLDDYMTRARALAPDPLQALLVFLGLYVEMGEGLVDPPDGCLFASFAYESGQFSDEVTRVLEHVIVAWRERIAAWLEEAAAAHPPVRPFDAESLADMLTVVFEGALVVARSMQDRRMFAAQVRHYRTYIELLFGSAGEPRVSS